MCSNLIANIYHIANSSTYIYKFFCVSTVTHTQISTLATTMQQQITRPFIIDGNEKFYTEIYNKSAQILIFNNK